MAVEEKLGEGPEQRIALIRQTHEQGHGLSRGDVDTLFAVLDLRSEEVKSLRDQVDEAAELDKRFSDQVLIAGELLRVSKRLVEEDLNTRALPLTETQVALLAVVERAVRDAPNLLMTGLGEALGRDSSPVDTE